MNPNDVADHAHDLMFGVRRSRRYHLHRQRFFGRIDIVGSMGTLLLGASAWFLRDEVGWVAWFTGVVAAIGVVKVAGRVADRASKHARLAVEFTDLERDMLRAGGIERMTLDQLDEFLARRVDIEAEEPPPHRVIDTICHNQEVMAGDYGEKHLRRVTLFQRIFASVIDLQAYSLPKKVKSVSDG